jgi:GAF domain-containing protein/CheY-like chemotaxis protein
MGKLRKIKTGKALRSAATIKSAAPTDNIARSCLPNCSTISHSTACTTGDWDMVAGDHKKQKILVVDDEPDNLDLLYRTFHREFKVLRAENGPVALEILEKERDIAVIISDQRMPLMSGTEFLSLTAKQYPDIIRIILTGYTDVDDLVEAINSGKVFKYVTKPWDDQELRQVVRQASDTHNVLKARTEELRRNLRRETLLNTITSTIRGELSYAEILQTIVTACGQAFDASYCLLRPIQNGQLENDCFTYTAADLTASPTANFPIEQRSAAALAITSHLEHLAETVWIVDRLELLVDAAIDQQLQTCSKTQQQAYQAAAITSSLMIPLVCHGERIAVLALHQVGMPRQWQSAEIELVSIVADQTALALSQVRAYEQVQALAKREALINTVTKAIRSSLDPQEIFSAITQQLGQALQVDGCALSLWTEDDEYVQCVGLHDSNQQSSTAQIDAQPSAQLDIARLDIAPLDASQLDIAPLAVVDPNPSTSGIERSDSISSDECA